MKIFKYLPILLFISCSSSRVNYDYDRNTQFAKYNTYNFFEDAGDGLSDIDKKRMRNNIARYLNLKGMQFSENPDILVNFFSQKWSANNQSQTSLGLGIGGISSNVGLGISGIPLGGSKKIDQLMTIDFVDAKSNDMIWQGEIRGRISENISPLEKEEYIGNSINKVLRNYPPKK